MRKDNNLLQNGRIFKEIQKEKRLLVSIESVSNS